MVVLSAIGRFFKKIWDWIKQTAWIQPLLIVGIIFGVIFSIPSIVKGIKNAINQSEGSEVFYFQYQNSLEGEGESNADKLTNKIFKIQQNESTEKEITIHDNVKASKFFLVYVSETCTECATIKGAFQVLEEKLSGDENAIFKAEDGKPFNMATIFTDQTTTYDDSTNTPFGRYLDRNAGFFESVADIGGNTDYCRKGNLNKKDLSYVEEGNKDMFLTPTILLVDLDPSTKDTNKGYSAGVTEVMFGIGSGSSDYERAKVLLDCWNHTGAFDFND